MKSKQEIIKEVDYLIKFIDSYYNEEYAIDQVKYMINLINNSDDIIIQGLIINEGVIKSWYTYIRVITDMVSKNQLSKEVIESLFDTFISHFNKLLFSNDRPNYSDHINNLRHQIAVNGFFEMILDRDFTRILFQTNMLCIMSIVHSIPQSLGGEIGDYIYSEYVHDYDSVENDKTIII